MSVTASWRLVASTRMFSMNASAIRATTPSTDTHASASATTFSRSKWS